ncbi:MAG: hypothetical protein JRF18_06045, partial [Deltaproteobacteria bacterium]|nr:hypothetical protein [Deltaproteobacteria bacterium]
MHRESPHLLLAGVIVLLSFSVDLSAQSSEGIASSAGDTESSPTSESARISTFGQYSGYSEARYNSFVRESVFRPVHDKTQIALDLYYPAIDGAAETDPMPVVLHVTRYWRSREMGDGGVYTPAGLVPSGSNWAELTPGTVVSPTKEL